MDDDDPRRGWRPWGSFTYKNVKPQYIFFQEEGQDIAAKLVRTDPGEGRITFHNVLPHIPGINRENEETRVDQENFHDIPPVELFALLRLPALDEVGQQPEPIDVVEDNGLFIYRLFWIVDYQINLYGQPYRRLIQQHQSARYIPIVPRGGGSEDEEMNEEVEEEEAEGQEAPLDHDEDGDTDIDEDEEDSEYGEAHEEEEEDREEGEEGEEEDNEGEEEGNGREGEE